MAKYVYEIVNPELFTLTAEDTVQEARAGILDMCITAAPVLEDDGTPIGVISLRDLVRDGPSSVGGRMTKPPYLVPFDSELTAAGRKMAELNLHHLVAVDEAGRAVGMLSSLDVVRALLAIPVRHPDAFPHIDPTGIQWSDPAVLSSHEVARAPKGPGLLLLIRSEAQKPELPMWAEEASDVRGRLEELLTSVQHDFPDLAALLKHRDAVRFRAASVSDAKTRSLGLRRACRHVTATSWLPPEK